MSIINKSTAWLALTGMLFLTAVTSAYASISPAGLPAFENSVKLQIRSNGNWTARKNSKDTQLFFNDATQLYVGEIFKFNFQASFSNSGVFQGGSMSILGTLPDLGITNKMTVLMSADLVEFGQLAPNKIGFNTANIICDSGLGVACTLNESVIFTLNTVFQGPNTRLNTTAQAITTVPLPAVAWLFGSGLCFLGVTARRRTGKSVAV